MRKTVLQLGSLLDGVRQTEGERGGWDEARASTERETDRDGKERDPPPRSDQRVDEGVRVHACVSPYTHTHTCIGRTDRQTDTHTHTHTHTRGNARCKIKKTRAEKGRRCELVWWGWLEKKNGGGTGLGYTVVGNATINITYRHGSL